MSNVPSAADLRESVDALAGLGPSTDPATAVAGALAHLAGTGEAGVEVVSGTRHTWARRLPIAHEAAGTAAPDRDRLCVDVGCWRGLHVVASCVGKSDVASQVSDVVGTFGAVASMYVARVLGERFRRLASGPPDRVAAQLTALLGFTDVDIFVVGGGGCELTLLHGASDSESRLDLDRGLPARALRLKRSQYCDQTAGIGTRPAIAVPVAVGARAHARASDTLLLVLRGRESDLGVLPYELDLADHAAEVIAAQYGPRRGGAGAADGLVHDFVRRMASARHAVDGRHRSPSADLLTFGANGLADLYGADAVWMTRPRGDGPEHGRDLTYVAVGPGCEPETIEIARRPSVADDLQVPLVVDRATRLRASEESALVARGMRSYACASIGDDSTAAIGVASGRLAAFDALLLEPLRSVGFLMGLLTTLDEATEDVAALRRRVAVATSLSTRLLTVLGHQFRTPLTLLRGYAAMLVDRDSGTLPGSADPDAAEGLLKTTARLEHLVENSTVYADIALGNYVASVQTTDADVAAGRAIDVATQTDHVHRIRRQLRAGIARVDAHGLHHIVRNLVDNALRYSNGEVRVRTTVDAGEFLLDVADTGPGLTPAERARVRDSFSSDADLANPSIGLGLTIVDGVVRAAGGSLDLVDLPDGGLSARVVLPAS